MCKDNNSSVIFLSKLMKKKIQLAPNLVDQVKGTFNLRESSYSESNNWPHRGYVWCNDSVNIASEIINVKKT